MLVGLIGNFPTGLLGVVITITCRCGNTSLQNCLRIFLEKAVTGKFPTRETATKSPEWGILRDISHGELLCHSATVLS